MRETVWRWTSSLRGMPARYALTVRLRKANSKDLWADFYVVVWGSQRKKLSRLLGCCSDTCPEGQREQECHAWRHRGRPVRCCDYPCQRAAPPSTPRCDQSSRVNSREMHRKSAESRL